ncbi:MAG: MlaD family protein [Candidatus Omnitrophota bacterium]
MKLSNEIKIGIFVVMILVSLMILTIKVGNFNIGQEGYNIKVVFLNIDGVETNAPVRLNGLEVGLVKDIKIKYDDEMTKMELILWLNQSAKIREGAKAFIKNMGLMGEKYVGLTSGDKGAPFLKENSVIIGQEPTDFEALITKGDEIAQNLKEISANINERLKVNSAAIDEIVANVNTTSKNLASISTNVDERLKVNEKNIDEILAHLAITGKNLEELSVDLKLNPWKLLHREKAKKTK